jgi:hypothetical protein
MENLREKVLNKNPNEFYYNMINAKMVEGDHKVKGGTGSDDFTKNLKLLDLTRMVQKNKAARLQNQLHLTEIEKQNTHTYFVTSKTGIKRKAKELEKAEETKKEKKEELLANIAFEKFGGDLEKFREYYAAIQQEKKKTYHSKRFIINTA